MDIVATKKYLFVISNSSFLKVYDIVPSEPTLIQNVDLTQIDQELQSYDLFAIRYTQQ